MVKDFLSSFNEYQDGHVNSLAEVISSSGDAAEVEDGKTSDKDGEVAPSASFAVPSAGLLSFFG